MGAAITRLSLLRTKHPERICWGCDKHCPADDLACGNGTIRTPHPCELFGDDWLELEAERHPTGSTSLTLAAHSSGSALP